MSLHDCPTCSCESAADREARLNREWQEIARKQREQEFVRRHAVLTDGDVAAAKSYLESRAGR